MCCKSGVYILSKEGATVFPDYDKIGVCDYEEIIWNPPLDFVPNSDSQIKEPW
jgi:hypothetical protein